MSNYKRTLTMTIIISLFLIILIISAGSSPVLDNLDNHDNDFILLNNAKIDTSLPQSSKAVQNIAISQNQVDENGYYLVQFKGYTKEEWKQSLRASGAVLYDYVPNNAFIAMMNSSVKSQVEALDSVKWVGIYEPGYRISPALSSSAAIMGKEPVNENITVLLFDARDNQRVSDEITGLGGEIISNSGNRIRVSIAKTKIPDVAQINGVSWMEKYVQPVLMNDVAANITTAYSVRNTHGLTGAGQIVAVADSGLDTGVDTHGVNGDIHLDFDNRVTFFNYMGSSPDDNNGHGTHTTGSIAGNGYRSNGQYKGMAPEAYIISQGLGDNAGSNYIYFDDLTGIFQDAYNGGARIHSDSWGVTEGGAYTIISQETDQYVWSKKDMTIVMAAGNLDVLGISSPGTAKNTITVGASENFRLDKDIYSDNPDDVASFSAIGPTDDNRIKPDIVAPGTYIISTRSSMPDASYSWGILNQYDAYDTGTSMSTPIVAGISALTRQYFMNNESISPSAALIKATLVNGATNLSVSPDYQGWGRVDIENSLFPALPRIMRYYDNSTGLSFNQSWNTSYYVENSSEPFRVTLVWSDYPGVPYAGITLVNNLDLIVTGPDDRIYYGNGAPDTRNNVEQVELVSPSLGLYTIRINGTNIPQGPQPFAVVISGALDFLPPSASNEFPTNNSYTNNNTTNAAVNITDSVSGVNLSSIDMIINGSYVSFSNASISNGYRVQNVTTVPYSDGRVNVSINATNNDSKSLIYSWSFIVDTKAPQVTINPISYQRGTAAKTGSIIEFNVSANDPVVSSTSSGLKNASVNASLINNTGIIALINNSGFWKGNVTFDKSIADGNYSLNVSFSDNASNINSSERINVSIDNTPPSVEDVSISVSPAFINLTDSINITANITSPDSVSEVNQSEINARITYPNGTSVNYPMLNGSGDLFYKNFSDTAQYGRYNVTILANDTTGNMNSTQQTRFTTSRISNLVVNITEATETFTVAPYSNTTLRLYTNNSSNGTIQISQSKVNLTSNTSDFSNPGIYVLVNASQEIRNNLTYVVLSVNYTDADVSSFVESSLRLYRWNTTSSKWEKLSGPGLPSFVNDAGVDTVNNFVWANLTNLSEFAVGGNLYTPPSQQISSGGGGGGGGGGRSGENVSNIEVIEKYDLQISKDTLTAYRFTDKKNPLMYVNITGNTSLGIITASVEVLKGTSTLVSFPPEGLVYKNANIWVGTAGFATPKNIRDALIKFRVENSWMSENSVQNSAMVLEKWDGSNWIQLETKFVSKDDTYSIFEGRTNSFSPFAIVAKTGVAATITPTTTSDSGTTTSPGATGTAPGKAPVSGFPGWLIVVIVIVIIAAAVYFLSRKKR